MKTFTNWINHKEHLNEMSSVYTDKKYGMKIDVNPDTKRNGDWYFKVYNSSSFDKAEKLARIKFLDPSYVVHKGKPEWELTSKDKKHLIEILKRPSHNFYSVINPDHLLTVWEHLIVLHNLERGLPQEKTENNFTYDLKYKNYLPIDLEIPPYQYL